MKNKTTKISAMLMLVLISISTFAQDRVYVNTYCCNGNKAQIVVFEKGTSKTITINNILASSSSSNQVLGQYLSQGYKLVNSITYNNWCVEYILEKR
jgi:hypothetical protein